MEINNINYCSSCDNITYYHANEMGELLHFCKNCNLQEPVKLEDNCIYSLNFQKYDKSDMINHNKYITHDKTLPGIINNPNITCTNKDCCSNTEHLESNIKYIKYDNEDMKYIYICTYCGQKWT